MKITLKNFRCYENSSFDFGEKGLALLSGPSGAGKSSILLGIYFGLFGTGTKLTMYGKTSCSIILEFDGMIITRTKKPCRLVVDDNGIIYEDDAAQGVINNKFGETFQTTGYICQNAINSFILMSPIEKLGFLEKFAFKDTDLLQIKTRCKNVINERYENLLKTTSQLEIACAMIQELKEPEYMEFPLYNATKRIMSDSMREKAIKNTTVKYKNSNTLILKCTKKIKCLKKEFHSIEILETKIQSKQESIESINKKLNILLKDLENCNKISDSIYIEKYEEELLFIITQKELISLQSRYEEDIERLNVMKKDELSDTVEKIKVIEKDLWKEYTEEEAKCAMNEYKEIMKDLEKIQELQNDLSRFMVDEEQLKNQCDDIEVLKKELEIKKKLQDKLEMQKGVFQCPSCKNSLKFVSEKLQLSCIETGIESDLIDTVCLDEDVLKLNKKISYLESVITSKQNKLERFKETERTISDITSQYLDDEDTVLPVVTDIKKDLEYMKKYISSQQTIEKHFNSLKIIQKQIEKDQKYSNYIESFESSTQNKKRNIESLVQKIGKLSIVEIRDDEESIRRKIIDENQKKIKIEGFKQAIKELEKEVSIHEKQLELYKEDHLKEFTIIRTLTLVNSELNEYRKEYEELQKKKEELETDIKNIEKYKEYEKTLDSYKSWTDKIKILKREESENRKQYGAATILKDKILEAESIAMLNVISSINTHSQVYLDSFFPDNPISVKLVTFKETKKGKNVTKKPQINLQIEYKGMECDLTSLSGGEMSRVILAFAMALGEMFNTPMMLLDECTASLDQDLTSEVMDGIRDNFNGKLVLIIAHQTVKGCYNKVIEI
jgi:exonuclease SbcC